MNDGIVCKSGKMEDGHKLLVITVRPTIMYRRRVWCLHENEMGILQRREISTVRAMFLVQLRDRKAVNDWMLMFGLIEATNQIAMADSVHWYGHVLRGKMVMS